MVLPAKWLEQYNLAISDPLIGHRDPDGEMDSAIFWNYKAGTNPAGSIQSPLHIR